MNHGDADGAELPVLGAFTPKDGPGNVAGEDRGDRSQSRT